MLGPLPRLALQVVRHISGIAKAKRNADELSAGHVPHPPTPVVLNHIEEPIRR